MDDRSSDNLTALRHQLGDSFGILADETEPNVPLQERIGLREELAYLPPEQARRVLPVVLDDLLSTHTGEIGNGTEDVMAFRGFVHGDADQNRSFFDSFSDAQARAVYAWLLTARWWYELHTFSGWLRPALEYWSLRAQQPLPVPLFPVLEPPPKTVESQLLDACFHGRISDLASLLRAGASPNFRSLGGRTPIGSAVSGRQFETIDLLLSKEYHQYQSLRRVRAEVEYGDSERSVGEPCSRFTIRM